MIKLDAYHSMEEYLDLLSSSLTIYMDAQRLNDAYTEVCNVTDDLRALTLLWLRIESAGLYTVPDSNSIIDYLCRIGIDMEGRYANKRTKSISLDLKRVVAPLIEKNVSPELLSTYRDYRSFNSYCSSIRALTESQQFHARTVNGRTLVKFPTHVEERDNLRTYYSNISVVSVPKRYSQMITGPSDNHFIAWCDYPQADWRFAYNLFIRDKDNFKVMSSCEDAYEGLARLVEKDKFDPSVFADQRKEYKVHSLKVYYNSRDNAPIPSAIRNYFMSCPKYKRLQEDLKTFYQFKLPIPCTSYFGYEQLLPEGTYPDAFISKGMNTPIQTFTSHIVKETVFTVLQKFWDLGYTKEQANVYYVRHDEPLFLFSRDVLKDSWVFAECSEIYIPGFTPIHLDWKFGEYYQEEDPALTSIVQETVQKSNYVPTVYEPEDPKEYWPFPTVESIYVQLFRREDIQGFLVNCYNYRNGVYREILVDNVEDPLKAVTAAVEKEALAWVGNPQYLLVRTNGLDFMDYIGPNQETLMRVIDRYDSSVAGGGLK